MRDALLFCSVLIQFDVEMQMEIKIELVNEWRKPVLMMSMTMLPMPMMMMVKTCVVSFILKKSSITPENLLKTDSVG